MEALTGQTSGFKTIEHVFKALAETISEFNGLSLSKISDQGVSIVATNYKIPLLENERARKAAGIING